MTRHRETRLQPGQDVREVVGRTLWQRTRPNGDQVVLRGFLLPRPHVAIEVWRGDKSRSVRLAVSDLAALATALIRAPRTLGAEAASGKGRTP